MKPRDLSLSRLEIRLATLLHLGTCVACGLIGFGLLLTLPGLHAAAQTPFPLATNGNHFMQAGIAVFILLPVLRVGVMLAVFLQQRDYRFVAIATLVLIIILTSALLGIYAAHAQTLG